MSDPIRVLCVADSPEVARDRAATLERADERLVADAGDGAAGLSELPGGFDCVVVEGLVGESAAGDATLLESIREVAPELPVVLVAEGDDGVVAGAIADGDPDAGALLVDRIRAAVTTGPSTGRRARTRADTVPDLAFYADAAGRSVDVLTGGETVTTHTDPDRLQGERLRDILPADPAERIHHAVGRALDTGEGQTVQYRRDVGSDERWFEARIAPVDHGEQALVVTRDITTHKERETALTALHEIATTIQAAESVEAACELTVTAAADILDFETCIVSINEGDWLVPYATSEKARPDIARSIHIEEGLAGKTFRTGEPYVVDHIEDDDDTRPTFDTIESGLSVPIGEHGVFQAVSTEPAAFDQKDITLVELLVSHTTTAIDRIEREQTLTHKTERLEEFASFVSHDLRNPLNVATLRLELARDACDTEHLDGLERALDRMERLIEELLTLARQGETIGETEPVQLADLVSCAWQNVETENATLDSRTGLTLYADQNRLTAVLENLIRNAVEHGSGGADPDPDNTADPAGGTVTVTVGDLADGTGFYVADDGPGIPEAQRDQVFDSGYSTHSGGTGFGLTIVRDIADAHGWDIQITDSEHGGARFEITGVERVG